MTDIDATIGLRLTIAVPLSEAGLIQALTIERGGRVIDIARIVSDGNGLEYQDRNNEAAALPLLESAAVQRPTAQTLVLEFFAQSPNGEAQFAAVAEHLKANSHHPGAASVTLRRLVDTKKIKKIDQGQYRLITKRGRPLKGAGFSLLILEVLSDGETKTIAEILAALSHLGPSLKRRQLDAPIHYLKKRGLINRLDKARYQITEAGLTLCAAQLKEKQNVNHHPS
jgi:hypothetical protein